MLDYESRWIYKARFVGSVFSIILFGILHFSGWYKIPYLWFLGGPLFLIVFGRAYAWPTSLIPDKNARYLIGQLLDIICITWSLHFIGGMNMFVGGLYYAMVIIYSSFILSTRSSFIIANFAFLMYGLMVYLEINGIIPMIESISVQMDTQYRLLMTIIYWPSFNLIAYFSAYHSRALKLGRNELDNSISQLQCEINEKEKAQRDLQIERQKLTTIFDSIDEPVYVTDLENYKLLYANEAFKKIWGEPGDKTCHMIMNEKDEPCQGCNSPDLAKSPNSKPAVIEVYNKATGKWFKCVSKLLQWTDNRWVRYDMKIDITAQKRMELIQAVLFEISDAAHKNINLDDLLKIIHHALGTLMDTSNFFIALYDSETDTYTFPYNVDKYDVGDFSPQQMKKSLTDYVRRTGKSVWVDQETFDKLAEAGEVESIGKPSPIWIGAPLNTPAGAIGIVALQNYEDADTYTKKDLEVLTHVSGHIASAIERKVSEKALSDSMSLMKSTIESTADGILVVNNEGKILYANERFSKLWNIPEVPLHAEDDSKFLDHVTDQLEDPEQFVNKVMDLHKSADEDFDTLYFKDGRVFERYSCPLLDSEKVTGRVWSFRDITDNEKAWQLLQQSEHSYRSFLESMQDGVVITDLDENLLFVNNAFCKILDYEVEELIGKNLREFVVEEDFGRLIIGTQKRRRKENSKYDIRIIKKGLEVRDVMISATPLLDNQTKDVKGSVGIFTDITEIKKSEKEKRELRDKLARAQRMESLGILAGGVAHDLNNILGPLVAYPDIIRMNLEHDHPVLNHITKIENSAQRAAGVVQDLLTMARRGRYDMRPLNFNEVINEYLSSPDFSNFFAKHHSIDLRINLAPHLGNINGSHTHLSKVVMNLIINALEAMPDGGTLIIETMQKHIEELQCGFDNLEAGEYMIMTVMDTGLGIDEKDFIHLFEPFYTKKKMGRSGSGLGLAIVYGVIKDHNGYIDVVSEPDKGSKFYIYLPLCNESCIANGQSQVSDIRGNERILIVDDLEEQRELAATMLSCLGYQTETAPNGHRAVVMAEDTSYDLIILDMIMEGGFDGLDTYKELLRINPNQKAIIASGYSLTERVKEAEKLGVGKFVKKPYTMQLLGKAIREVLRSPIKKEKTTVS